MKVLKPSRIEYVSRACNWRRGCGHGCTYCYAAGMAHRFGRMPEGGWTNSKLLVDDPGKTLREELERRRKPVAGMILVSSSHDTCRARVEAGRARVRQWYGELQVQNCRPDAKSMED